MGGWLTACGSFDATDTPAVVGDASPEAASSDGSPGTDGADADGPTLDAGCRGAFQAPRTISTLDSGIGTSLRSVRGVANGTFLISYDTSPDDNMATAMLTPAGLTLATPNPFNALNGSLEETTPTGPSDLSFVVFASDRSSPPDGGPGILRLWITEFSSTAFGAPEYLAVAGAEPTSGPSINNPYLVGNLIYFDVQNVVGSGELVKATRNVVSVGVVPGVNNGSHPVVTKEQGELFTQIGAGILLSSRPPGATFSSQGILAGSTGDYPTWISDDACQLYAIHSGTGGRELRVYDRAR